MVDWDGRKHWNVLTQNIHNQRQRAAMLQIPVGQQNRIDAPGSPPQCLHVAVVNSETAFSVCWQNPTVKQQPLRIDFQQIGNRTGFLKSTGNWSEFDQRRHG